MKTITSLHVMVSGTKNATMRRRQRQNRAVVTQNSKVLWLTMILCQLATAMGAAQDDLFHDQYKINFYEWKKPQETSGERRTRKEIAEKLGTKGAIDGNDEASIVAQLIRKFVGYGEILTVEGGRRAQVRGVDVNGEYYEMDLMDLKSLKEFPSDDSSDEYVEEESDSVAGVRIENHITDWLLNPVVISQYGPFGNKVYVRTILNTKTMALVYREGQREWAFIQLQEYNGIYGNGFTLHVHYSSETNTPKLSLGESNWYQWSRNDNMDVRITGHRTKDIDVLQIHRITQSEDSEESWATWFGKILCCRCRKK